jgi:PTS system beta-glucosides-specific IIC component
MDADALAGSIVAAVGGPGNIRSVGHCTTRLRLGLIDKGLADREAVRALPGIMSTVERGGQFQVVVGHEVADVDRRVRDIVASAMDGREPIEAEEPMSVADRVFDLITGTFHPLLWALIGASMVKTMLTLAVELDLISTDSPTYAIWSAAGNAAFFFLPILVGITASARLGANPYVGGVIAAALLHESFTDLGPPGTQTSFLGLPVTVIEYGQSVLPAFLAAVLLSVLERWLRRRLPASLRMIVVPTVCIAILVPATALVFGPIGSTVADAVSDAVQWVWELSPAVAGALMGGLWQVFVMFGVHWGFVPVIVNDLAEQGYSLLTGPLVAAVLAQGAATLAVFLRTRNPAFRALAGASSVSAFVAGVTEPAIYGVTLRLRRPFMYACIGGAVGGAIAAVGRSAADAFVFPGLVTLPAYLNVGSFTHQVTGTVTAVIIAFGLTYVLGFEDVPVTETPTAPPLPAGAIPAARTEPAPTESVAAVGEVRAGPAVDGSDGPGAPDSPGAPAASGAGARHGTATTRILAPLPGLIVPLDSVADPVFAKGLLGPGVAIRPSAGGLVRSPVAGRVTSVARAKHALGLTTANGVDLMIHVGIDTVHLAGRHFEILIRTGDEVTAGQPIAYADIPALLAEGYDPTTPVVVTNAAAVGAIEVVAGTEVGEGDPLLEVLPSGS